MNHRVSVLLAIFALIAVPVVRCQEGGVEVAAEMTPFCAGSLELLRAEIMAFGPSQEPPAEIVINCLAFGQERTLETGIVSSFPLNGAAGTRYVISCQNNAIVFVESTQPARRLNFTAQEHTACTECRDVSAAADICPDQARCPAQCERCAIFSGQVFCTVCDTFRLLNNYQAGTVPTAEQIERQRERFEANGQEEVCTDNPLVDVELATSFTCVDSLDTCPVVNGLTFEPSPESNTCYACGIEYCVECEESRECTACLDSTILFDGECFSCPLALVARTAILQEEEERSEVAIQRRRQIELAVALPIVSFLVIVVFISLSIYAHHRYPHISYQGHKRHRTKQDVFTNENSTGTPAHSAGEEPPSDSDVWRARPSIRFR